MATQKRKPKRINPKSVMVYFPGEKVELLQQIEKVAEDINMPMSILCFNLMKMSLPTMRYLAASMNGENQGIQISKITVERDHEAERINNVELAKIQKAK